MFSRYRYIEGLTSLHGSNNEYLINYLGEIRDKNGREVPTSRDEDGHITVNVTGWDGPREYRVIDLVAIQYKDLRIGASNYHRVDAFVLNGDKEDPQCKNVGYRFSGGPIEVSGAPGFFHVPGFTRYGINREGQLINTETLKEVSVYFTKPVKEKNITGGYAVYPVVSPTGKGTSLGRHRALGLTFLECPDEVDKLIVNHIDGVPGNDDLSNLEWATRSWNNHHAFMSGLKSQNRHVIIKDVRTGEETEYHSITEAVRKKGLAYHNTLLVRLNSQFGKVFSDGMQVKYKDDPRDFPKIDDVEATIEEAKLSEEVKVRHCKTLSEATYSSMTKAGHAIGVSNGTIALRLTRDDRAPVKGFQIARKDDDRPWPDFTEEEYLVSLKDHALKVVARNILTGEYLEFNSVASAARRFGNGVKETLREGRQHLDEFGWQVRLENDIFEDVDNPEETCYGLRKKIMAKHEETGKIILADSCRQMSKILGKCPKMIKKKAMTRGKEIYHEYRFKLGLDEPWPV